MTRMKMSRAQARAYKKKVAVGLCCMAMVTSNVLLPIGSGKYVLGGKVVKAAQITSEQMSEDTVHVNINKLQIENQKAVYKITKDGSYCFSGSNLRNGVRVTTQIVVEEGVKADIFLDNVDVQNVDGYMGECGSEGLDGTSPFVIKGDANLIIVNDSSLSGYYDAKGAIVVTDGASLTIQADSEDKKLDVRGTSYGTAGIAVAGTLIIESGTINAIGSYRAAGIGSAPGYVNGNIVINGGNITAIGGKWCAGIGSGESSSVNEIIINGGTVSATGGSHSAGIGTGYRGSCGSIKIAGGDIKAVGASNQNGNHSAIGAGQNGTCDKIIAIGGSFRCDDAAFTLNETINNEDDIEVTIKKVILPDANEIISMGIAYTYTDAELNTSPKSYFYNCNDISPEEDNSIFTLIPDSTESIEIVAKNSENNVVGYVLTLNEDGAFVENVEEQFTPHTVTYYDKTNNEVIGYGYSSKNNIVRYIPSGLPYSDYIFEYADESVYDGTNVTEDKSVYAVANAHMYNINYSGDYTGNDTAKYGDDIELPVPEKGVYEFRTEDGSTFTGKNITKDVNVTVTKKYEVKFVDEQDTLISTSYANSAGEVALLTPPAGYTYNYNVGETSFDGTGVTDNVTVTVVKNKCKYYVTYIKDGEEFDAKELEYGDSVALADLPEGYIYVDSTGNLATYVNENTASIYLINGEIKDNKVYMTISSPEELQEYRKYLNESGLKNLCGELTDDINVTTVEENWNPIGTNGFDATFDGQGHTVNYNINSVVEHSSLFTSVGNATIKNLNTTGKIVTTGKYAAGIVGHVLNGTTCVIENCSSSVDIEFIPSGDMTAGGMIGITENDAYVNIVDCLYTGTLSKGDGVEATLSGQGGIIGWASTNYNIEINNCVVAAEFDNTGTDVGETFCRNSYNINNCYYVNACGWSSQGVKIEDTDNVSEIAWKLNTDNGKNENSGRWTTKEGINYPVKADDTDKGIYRLQYMIDGMEYWSSYSKSGETISGLLDMTNETGEGYEFLGWYIGDSNASDVKATEETVITSDMQLIAKFNESVAHAKTRLQALCDNIELDIMTTASVETYSTALANAQQVLEGEETSYEDVTAAIEELNLAKQGLAMADGTLSLTSNPANTGSLTGGGKYAAGDAVTATAGTIKGYSFVGWYDGDNLKSEKKIYKFDFNGTDMNLEARYESLGTTSITVTAGGTFTVNDGEEQSGEQEYQFNNSQIVTVKADNTNNTFAYWADGNGLIVSRNTEYTFTVNGSLNLYSVYNNESTDKTTVIFVNDSDQVLDRTDYDKSGTTAIAMPTAPGKKGYTFTGWSMTQEQIIDALANGSTIKVTPCYEQQTDTYSVKVTDGDITYMSAVDIDGKYQVGTNIKVTANEPFENQVFSHWEDKDGRIVSYSTTYFTKVTGDLELKAIFKSSDAVINRKPTILMTASELYEVEDVKKASFTTTRDVPEGCTQISYGMIVTANAEVGLDSDAFVISETDVKKATGKAASKKGVFTVNVKTKAGQTVYARGFVIYENQDGEQKTVYSDVSMIECP